MVMLLDVEVELGPKVWLEQKPHLSTSPHPLVTLLAKYSCLQNLVEDCRSACRAHCLACCSTGDALSMGIAA